MNSNRIGIGFVAGTIGAFILAAIMFVMQATELGGTPSFVGTYRAVFGSDASFDYVIATLLFAVAGGIWGAIYTALVKHPTVLNGALFGILPTLWLWLAAAPMAGKPIFNGFTTKGIIMPILFNVVIWGTFVGWYCSKRVDRHAIA